MSTIDPGVLVILHQRLQEQVLHAEHVARQAIGRAEAAEARLAELEVAQQASSPPPHA